MKKVISLGVVLAMVLSLMLAVLPVSALAPTDYYAVDTVASNAYGIGPNFMMSQDIGYFAQTIETTKDILGIGFGCWEASKDGTATVDIDFYEFNEDLETSLDGDAVVTMTVNVNEGQFQDGIAYDLPNKLPAGKYVVMFYNVADGGFHMAAGEPLMEDFESYAENCTSVLGDQAVCMTICTEMPSTIMQAAQIKTGNTKLENDIVGQLNVSEGTYVIDLAGHTWSNGDVALKVSGTADVTVIDSVGGGKIVVNGNDGTQNDGGKMTFNGITISADGGGMDAIFANAGTTIVKNTTLYANKAGIDLSQNGDAATVIVDGATFAGYEGELDADRTCAIEFRNNNKDIELKGDIKFECNQILRREEATNALTDLITLGEDSTAVYGEDTAVEGYNNYISNTITYEFTGEIVVDPPIDPVPTSDFMSFVIIIAAAAMVVTVMYKKRAF